MYTIKNIKEGFKRNIISNFAPDIPNKTEEQPKEDDFKGNSLQDLKKLKEYLKNGLNSEEAEMINKHMDKIQEEAKIGLKEIASNMLKEGFSALDEKSYNSFKKLIEKSLQIKLPSWKDIIQKTINNSSEWSTVRTLGIKRKLNKDNFHGITIKKHIIDVRYDGIGTNDTLELSYNKTNGKLSNNYGFNKWIEKENEEENVNTIGNVNKSILDDNIQNLVNQKEKKEAFKKEENLLKKAIDTINNYDINGKTEKDFKTFINSHYYNLIKKMGVNKISGKHLELNKEIGDLINKKLLDIKEVNKKRKGKEKENEKTKENSEFSKESIDNAINWYKGKPKKAIKKIQSKLKISENGIVGPNTVKAITDFQKKHGLETDGKAGIKTLKALGLDQNIYNKKEKTTQKTKKQQEKTSIKDKLNGKIKPIDFGVDKEDIIKNAIEALKINNNTSINQEQPIGVYTYNGETHNIVLKGNPGNYKVELDGTGLIDDIDQKVIGDTVKDINNAVQTLIKKYQKQLEQKEKETFPKNLGKYTNYEGKTENIILKENRSPGINGEEDKITYILEFDNSTPSFHNDIKKEFDNIPTSNQTEITIKELQKKVDNYNLDIESKKENELEEQKKEKENKETTKEVRKILEKSGIIGKTDITITSGDYKGETYTLDFDIDGDKLKLDSKWNQPGTDKKIQINKDQVIGKKPDEVITYINSLKNKLISQYKEQVAKEKKNNYDPTKTENER